MRIGELAKRSGTSVQTLRYYEREGILRRPARTASGYRAYSAADAEHVIFLRNCQAMGFTLNDIRTLSAMHGLGPALANASPGHPQAQFLALARERLAQIEGKIADLKQLQLQIGDLIRRAEAMPAGGCPANFRKNP